MELHSPITRMHFKGRFPAGNLAVTLDMGAEMRKSGLAAFVLWALGIVGLCGLHRFYVGRPFTGILWLLTFGLLGFGQLFDLFFLGSMVRQANILNGLNNMNHNSNVNTMAPVFNVSVNVPGAVAPEAPKLTP